MLRALASRSQGFAKIAGQSQRLISSSTQQEGNSIANLVNAVNAASTSNFAAGGLARLKQSIEPSYAVPAGASEGMSASAKLLLGAAAGWFLYRADTQARSKDWIVDLSLDVLQAAWLISFASFIPFRSVYVALRSMAPHTATPLQALRPVVNIK